MVLAVSLDVEKIFSENS